MSFDYQSASITTPHFLYFDDRGGGQTVIAKSESRQKLLDWWFSVKFELPFKHFVADRTDDPRTCSLRLRLGCINEGMKIDDVFKKYAIPCDNLPPINTTEFILKNLQNKYEIEGRSYQILNLISSHGCYGDVFLAENRNTKEKVAIKILRNNMDQEHSVMKTMQEVYGGHPNIVKYIGYGRLMDRTWIVMEYIRGEMLGQYLKHSEITQEMHEQINSAQKFMRDCRVTTNRENDMENILIAMENGKPKVKLIDFGTLAVA